MKDTKSLGVAASAAQDAAHPLQSLLRPRSIAIVGASRKDEAVGRKVLGSVLSSRWQGQVYPVNPGYDSIAGLQCYPDLAALPERPDLAVLAIRDSQAAATLAEAARLGIPSAVIFGRGFEPDAPATPLPERLGEIARAAGMSVCGGNCMGFLNSVDDLRLSFGAPRTEGPPCGASIVVHSGSMWEWMIGNHRNLQFDYAVSAGQEIATTAADYIDFFLDQPGTRVIGCVLETIRDPEGFARALDKARQRDIPVVVLKLGRSERGREFARAHTGALTAQSAVYSAFFRKYGVLEVSSMDELLDTLELFRLARPMRPGGVGMVTHSGGERQLIVDLAETIGTPITSLTDATRDALTQVLEPGLTPDNPVDVWGDGKLVAKEVLGLISDDPGVAITAFAADLFFSGGMDYGLKVCESFAAETQVPFAVIGCSQSSIVPEAAARLRAARIPVLEGFQTGLKALALFCAWQDQRGRILDAGPAIDQALTAAAEAAFAGDRALSPQEAARLLQLAGIAVPGDAIVGDRDSALQAAARFGYPVVLKTANPAIEHKTEAGGVILNIADAQALAAAYDGVVARCGLPVQVQSQIGGGLEMLVGMVDSAEFGPVVTVALGGVTTELFRDHVTFLPPMTAPEVRAGIRTLRSFPLLDGFRGAPPADVDGFVDLIVAFGEMCRALAPFAAEIDLNPVIVGPDSAIAVDALFVPRLPKGKI